MRQAKRNGYVIILALLAIVLVGTAVFILTGLANDLLFDANLACLQAYNRNLSASALAWAQHNRDKLKDSSPAEEIRLDTKHFKIPEGDLRLTLLEPRGKLQKLQIHTESGPDKMKLKRSDSYLIRPH